MRLAVIGGGGFRAPMVYQSVHALNGGLGLEEVVLHDTDAGRLARIQAVIRGMDEEAGGGIPVRTTTSLPQAVDGAQFVFLAVRVGGLPGRVVDETVPMAEGVLGQETVGPGGICFALRTVPVALDIARTVAEVAPQAWLLNLPAW